MSIPAAPTATAAAAPAAPQEIPWFGLTAVLLGAFIATLNGRISTFGLADSEGIVHAGFDQGAWITTAQTVAQMLICPIAIWVGGIFGARRPLIWAALAFAVISFLEPFSPNLPMLLTMQALGGLASGWFVPLTLSYILKNTPPRAWAYGVAIYALNLELSLNISASLEGFYVDHVGWHWIFWQNVPLALGMALCFVLGTRPEPAPTVRPPADMFGLISAGAGLALIYAGLDQGNRLDWLNSGLIWGLLLAGFIVLAAFYVHERTTPHPFINLKALFANPLPRLLLLVGFLRVTILATAYLIPLYLGGVRGYRALEVGQTLIWIAVPQLIFCPLAALMLRRSDPRLVASFGFVFIGLACLMVARGLTPLWGSDQFLPSQLLQALGQSFALSGIVFFSVLHLRPEEALTFGAAIQTARLMGGEIGTAFVVTFTRVRSQIASNQIGQHVQIGDGGVMARIQRYAAVTGRFDLDPALAQRRGVLVLGQVVRQAALTQGVIDCFVVVAVLTALALVLVGAHTPAPIGPASARPLIGDRRS